MKSKINFKVVNILFLLFSGCTTFIESTQWGGPPNYKQTKNSQGETVYRETKSAPTYSSPVIYPVYNPVNSISDSHSTLSASPAPHTASIENSSSNLFGYIEAANSDQNFHLGLHAGYLFNDYFITRLGTSFFSSNHELYGGFDLSGRAIYKVGFVTPFAGLGVYVGDTKKCFTQEASNGSGQETVCDKKFLYAAYSELGIEITFINIFWRNYAISRAGISIPQDQLYGIGIIFK